MPTGLRAMPVLSVTDVKATAEGFIRGFGFEAAGFWNDDDGVASFSILALGTVTLALQRSDAVQPVPGWAAYVYVDDIAGLHEAALAQGMDVTEPGERFYGCREIEYRDLDGNTVCFAQDLQPGPEGPGL